MKKNALLQHSFSNSSASRVADTQSVGGWASVEPVIYVGTDDNATSQVVVLRDPNH